MPNKIIPITVILFVLNIGCEKTGIEDNKDLVITKNTEQLIESDNEFGIELFKKVVETNPADKNVFISPVSAALALAMTYNGANGTTKEAMELTLKKDGMEISDINQSYKDLIEGLQSIDPKVVLDIANSIWYRNGFDVLPDFIQTNTNYFNALVQSLDFSSPEALETINNWVSDKTNDKITEILDEIPAEAMMYLINAVYFYGTWKFEFDKSKTAERDFYSDLYQEDQIPVKVDMMTLEAEINYMQHDVFSAVELPYGNNHYSMIIMLPDHDKSASEVIDLLSPDNWNNWIESFTEKEVVVSLPKFKFEFEEKLNDELTDMGMGVAFSEYEADFTKINPAGNLYISMVKQKAYVDVNEKGTEAAAVTVVEISLTSVGEDGKTHFYVDRPFLFVIMEKQSKSIVFIGKVALPEYSL